MKKESEDKVDPQQHPYLKDPLPVQVYHVAVWGIVIIILICVIGIIVLTCYGKTNEGLISIASACVGGLVSIFAQRTTTGNS